MPRGDGTGPFGSGPLNRNSKGLGRGAGRRRNMNASGNCRRNKVQGNDLPDRQVGVRSGSLLQGAVIKLLGVALAAVPAILKVRGRLSAPEKKPLLEAEQGSHPTVEVKAIPVDDPLELK